MGKKYWIVGASEGLGRALAIALDKAGAELILSARNKPRLQELADRLSHARIVGIDVTDAGSVEHAVGQVGQCDGVIYSVGMYEPVSAQIWDAQAVEAMCDVNFVGAVRLLGRLVPKFVAQDSGHIVIIGSLAGFRGLPGAIGYGASKSGLMHFAQTLQADLYHTGVKVQLINPGFVQTRLTQKNDFAMPQIMTPEDAASRVVKAMLSDRFQTNFPAPFSWLFTLGRFLPESVFQRLFGKSKRASVPK